MLDAAIGAIAAQGLHFEVSICTKAVYNMMDAGIFLNLSNQDLPVKKPGKKRTYKRTRSAALNNTKGRSIEERPAEIEKREGYGHREMDCVVGRGQACLPVLTERQSLEEIVMKMVAKTQACVKQALDRLERKYRNKFREKFQSITMDNGCEFLDMKGLETSCLNGKNPRRTRTARGSAGATRMRTG